MEAGGEFRLSADSKGFDCQIESFADDSIGIFAAGKYLAADWGGAVANDREWCREWEHFRLVRADTVAGLAVLRGYSWLSHSDRRIVSLADQPIDFGRDVPRESSPLAGTLASGAVDFRRELVFGPGRVRLVGRDQSLAFEKSGLGGSVPPARLHIVNPSGVTPYIFSVYAAGL